MRFAERRPRGFTMNGMRLLIVVYRESVPQTPPGCRAYENTTVVQKPKLRIGPFEIVTPDSPLRSKMLILDRNYRPAYLRSNASPEASLLEVYVEVEDASSSHGQTDA